MSNMNKTIYEPDGSSIEVEYDPNDCAHPREFWEDDYEMDYVDHSPIGYVQIVRCGLCGQEVNCRKPAEVVEPEFEKIQF
jgi:hypothetical protein